jgi:hypothetical protein
VATRVVAAPTAKSATAAGGAGAAALAASGKDLAAAKVAEVKGEPQKKKRRKMRRLLLWGSIAAALGFAYQKMRSNTQADNWQSSYTPPPSTPSAGTTSSTTSATTSTPASGGAHLAPGVGPDGPLATDDPMAKHAPEGDDPGGASPGEALADAVEEPHDPTTPDAPADVVDVEEQATKKK